MDCTFSVPQNYQGSAPVTGEPFAFAKGNCNITQFATPSATATSASVITFSPDLNKAFHDTIIAFMLVALLTMFVAFWFLANNVFKRR
jgi:hypothetical protein